MIRLVLIGAIAPAFALILLATVTVSIRSGRGSRALVTRLAPVIYAGLILAATALVLYLTSLDPVALGLIEPGTPQWTMVSLAVIMGGFLGVAGYLVELTLADRRTRGLVRTEPGMAASRSWGARPAVLVGLAMVTAVGEELLFRGYLLTGLRTDLPVWIALLIQAAVFAAHHGSFGWRELPVKFGHALLWGLAVVVTGWLLPALVAHVVFQLLVCRRLMRREPVGGGWDARARGTAAV